MTTQPIWCRKRKRITKQKDSEDSGSEFSLSDEAVANDRSEQAPSDNSAEFETDSELSDDPLGEYDDADDDMYEQRRHKYTRGQQLMQHLFLSQSGRDKTASVFRLSFDFVPPCAVSDAPILKYGNMHMAFWCCVAGSVL